MIDPVQVFKTQIENGLKYWSGLLQEYENVDQIDSHNLIQILKFGLSVSETQQNSSLLILKAFKLIDRDGFWEEWSKIVNDALKTVTPNDVELRIQLSNRSGQLYKLQNKFKMAMVEHQVALRLAKQHRISRFIAESQYNLGEVYLREGDFDSARELSLFALEFFQDEVIDAEWRASIFNTLGEAARFQGLFEDAQLYLEQAIDHAKLSGHFVYESRFRNNLALTLIELNQFNSAIDELNCAELILSDTLYEFDRTLILLNKGYLFSRQNQWQKAHQSFKRINIDYLKLTQHWFYYALTTTNLGYSYFKISAFSAAKENTQIAITVWERLGNRLNQATALKNLAEIFIEEGDKANAFHYLDEGLKIVSNLSKNHQVLQISKSLEGARIEWRKAADE